MQATTPTAIAEQKRLQTGVGLLLNSGLLLTAPKWRIVFMIQEQQPMYELLLLHYEA